MFRLAIALETITTFINVGVPGMQASKNAASSYVDAPMVRPSGQIMVNRTVNIW